MENYKVFKYDSHNSGRYEAAYEGLKSAQMYAKKNSAIKCRVEGADGFFEEFEKGVVTSWSVAGHQPLGIVITN